MAELAFGTVGLMLDIVGVAVLYIYTSTKTTEAELSYNLALAFTDEGGEWSLPYSFQEHLERLERTRILVAKYRRRARLGLALVGIGFILQGVALWL